MKLPPPPSKPPEKPGQSTPRSARSDFELPPVPHFVAKTSTYSDEEFEKLQAEWLRNVEEAVRREPRPSYPAGYGPGFYTRVVECYEDDTQTAWFTVYDGRRVRQWFGVQGIEPAAAQRIARGYCRHLPEWTEAAFRRAVENFWANRDVCGRDFWNF